MKIAFIIHLLLLVSIARSEIDKEICAIIVGCNLKPIVGCKNHDQLGPQRCTEAHELYERGLDPTDVKNADVYDFLGHDLRIVYDVERDLPIKPKQLLFMLNDLPLATKIVSRVRMTPYIFEYTSKDHRSFNIAKGEEAKGKARMISGSPDEGTIYYFGIGSINMGLIRATGPALVRFSYSAIPGKPYMVRCRMKVVIVMNNKVMGSFLNIGIVRHRIIEKIDQILNDVSESVWSIKKNDYMRDESWDPEDLKNIREFINME